MRRIMCRTIGILLIILIISGSTFAEDLSADQVITLRGEHVKIEEMLYILSANTGNDETLLRLALEKMTLNERREIAKQIGDVLIIIKEAESMGMSMEPKIACEIKWSRNGVLMKHYMERVRNQWDLSDRAGQAYFKAHPEEFVMAEAILARNILLKSESEANNVYLKLVSGGDFSSLAKEYSSDAQTASNGGNMDWLERGLVPQQIEKIIFDSKIGLLVPHKTDTGWQIFEIMEHRKSRQMSWEESKDEVLQRLERKYLLDEFDRLRKKWPYSIDNAALERLGNSLDTKNIN